MVLSKLLKQTNKILSLCLNTSCFLHVQIPRSLGRPSPQNTWVEMPKIPLLSIHFLSVIIILFIASFKTKILCEGEIHTSLNISVPDKRNDSNSREKRRMKERQKRGR